MDVGLPDEKIAEGLDEQDKSGFAVRNHGAVGIGQQASDEPVQHAQQGPVAKVAIRTRFCWQLGQKWRVLQEKASR